MFGEMRVWSLFLLEVCMGECMGVNVGVNVCFYDAILVRRLRSQPGELPKPVQERFILEVVRKAIVVREMFAVTAVPRRLFS